MTRQIDAEKLTDRYILAAGGVPETVQELANVKALEKCFEYSDNFDPSLARALLGLDGKTPGKLPDSEMLRIAGLLRRMGNLSDQDLGILKMVAIPCAEVIDSQTQG